MTTLSVVLPAYNESSCIGTLLDRIHDALHGTDITYEVVVVDDGSEDDTIEVAEQRSARMPVRILRHETNSGYGAALQTGLLEGSRRSDVVVTMDADDSHDPHLIPAMLDAMGTEYDVVIASRMQPGGAVVGVPFHRRLLSDVASVVLRMVTPMHGVRDFTSGYRAYRSTLLHSLIENQEEAPIVDEGGFVAGFAVLLKAWNSGARVTEVPLRLRYDRKLSDSRMRIFATARDYFRVLTIREGYQGRSRTQTVQAGSRKPDLVASVATVASDLVSVVGSFALAYVLYGWALQAGWLVEQRSGFLDYVAMGGIFGLLCVAILWRGDQYRSHTAAMDFRLLQSTVQYMMRSAGVFLAVLFFVGASGVPTLLIGLGVGLSVLSVLLGRRLTWSAGRKWQRLHGRGRRVLIYGSTDTGRLLMKKIMQAPGMGARVVGFVDGLKPVGSMIRCSVDHAGGHDFHVPILGRIRELDKLVADHKVDELLVAVPLDRSDLMRDLLARCEALGVDLGFVPEVGGVRADQLRVEDLSAITVLRPDLGGAPKSYLLAKRFIDLAISILLIVVAFPIWILLAVLIRLDSPGPAIFRQTRVGENGKLFEALKFRTLYVDADPYARSPNSETDQRVTRLGRYLRPAGLDELPQLWNILRGEMSLVGPRPEMPFIANEYGRFEKQRLRARPGITGLWQLSPDRGQEIHANMEYDLYYIRHRNLTLDWLILGETGLFAISRIVRVVGRQIRFILTGSRRVEPAAARQAAAVAQLAEANDGYVFVALDQRRRPDDPSGWNLGVSVSVALSRLRPVKLLVAPCNSTLIDGIVNQELVRFPDRADPLPEYVEYSSNSMVKVAAEAADVVLTDMPHVAAWARGIGAGLVRVDASGATIEPNGGRPVPTNLVEELRAIVALRDGVLQVQ